MGKFKQGDRLTYINASSDGYEYGCIYTMVRYTKYDKARIKVRDSNYMIMDSANECNFKKFLQPCIDNYQIF